MLQTLAHSAATAAPCVCHPRPHPVILSVTLQPPTVMFCEGPALHSAPALPLAGFKIKLRKLSNASDIRNSSPSTSGVWVIYTQPFHPPLLPAWDSMSGTGTYSLIGSSSAWFQTHVGWWLTGSNLRLSYFPSCLRASEQAVYFFNVAFVSLLTVSVTPAWQLFRESRVWCRVWQRRGDSA